MRSIAVALDSRCGIFMIVKIKDPDARRAAVQLLRRGAITVPEAAMLAGVSIQVVRYWCKTGGIKIGKARSAVIAKAWRTTMVRKR